MEEKKNNNLLIIILFVLLLIAVGVICFLLGSNSVKDNNQNNGSSVTEEKENNEDSQNNNNIKEETENTITPVSYTPKCNSNNTNYLVDIDETKYNNISEYIQDQDNVKLIINYFLVAEGDEKEYILTDSEKNSVLDEMKNSTFSIIESGFGGAGISSFKIQYERNNKQYCLSFWGKSVMYSEDGNIYKILDKSVDNTLTYQSECVYYFKNLSSSLTSLDEKLHVN